MSHVELRGVRPSAIAGTWYPGSPAVLRRTIEGYLAAVPEPAAPASPIGLIVPHAGYTYSGGVAAHAYRQVAGSTFDVVAIISPIHRGPFPTAGALLTAVSAYETPLGRVPLQPELVGALADILDVQLLREDEEHSLEIQLPFLQVVVGEFRLLPIMVADQSLEYCRRLGSAVARVLAERGGSALLVASTDLSHFHRQDRARRLDSAVIEHVKAYDLSGLYGALESGKAEACGGGPVIATMAAAEALGARRAEILSYATSGDVTGDHERVVGYVAGMLLA
jgi:MEMO1 family protein